MTEEIAVYFADMRTFLTPEEHQEFLQAKASLDEYLTKELEYQRMRKDTYITAAENKKNGNWPRALINLTSGPRKPIADERKYYSYIDTVRERKLAHVKQEDRWVAEMETAYRRKKEKEKCNQQIKVEREKFICDLKKTISDFKNSLAKEKKPKFAYPSSLGQCSPHSWCELDLPTTNEIEYWATPSIIKRVPDLIRKLVSREVTGQLLTLPSARYEYGGVPCVVWCFNIQVLAIASLRLTETQVVKEFSGVRSSIPVPAEELGQLYFGPVGWSDQEGFTTPIALLRLLTGGESEAPGITILSQDSVKTVYTIEGYDEYFVELHSDFIHFIRTISKGQPLVQALCSLGLIDDGIASLLEDKWTLPLQIVSKPSASDAYDPDKATTKLMELGWTEDDAKGALASSTFPSSASTEEIVKIILGKCH